jgi:hypothetical protein
MNNFVKDRGSERGGAGVKFLIVVVVLFLAANAGYNYIPVAYAAESMKSDMQTAVLQGLALPGRINPVDNVKSRLQTAMRVNDLPADALMEVKQNGNSMTAHVVYTKEVNILPFGIYRYTYHFDQTVTPTGFLLKQ